jgi:GTP-binding protein HflX
VEKRVYTSEEKAMLERANRAVLVGVNFSSNRYEECSWTSLDELEGLLETAGGVCCAKVLQSREVPDPATFLGSGKVEELKELVQLHQAGLIVLDNELSPTQIRNLERETEARVIDRSMLILDIFAMRATTREGKLQVELAQLKYMAPRLTSSYENLSRLGGGVGTRGPGESKLETDRRRIREKISLLSAELKQVVRTRDTMRKAREKSPIPLVSIIGYTNAGKSTLFNRFTDAGVLEEDRLFATLETVVRKVRFSDTCEALVSDTVGFIKKLPHHLVEAFKSTLEEMCYADVILHVIDVSNPNWEENERVSLETMESMGVKDTPVITVFNKCDQVPGEAIPKRENAVAVSARTGENLSLLREMVEQELSRKKRTVLVGIPYDQGRLLDLLHSRGAVLEMEYQAEYTQVLCRVDEELYGQIAAYLLPQ